MKGWSVWMGLAAGLVVVTSAQAAGSAGSPAAQALEKIKSLEGSWQTATTEGAAVKITFRKVAGGSAVMEEMSYGNMVTVYHLDGDKLVMTHYCAGNNQPHMGSKGLSSDGNSIDFDLQGVGNLADPKGMHMSDLVIRFVDADTITERWTHSAGGRNEPMEFKITRVK